ncbi:hypothetical protein [Aureimonas sp. AU20]|uniref:hypothetical protein n=1 Tax=Aureimonas sp. AU20 TaxID=1349819 RepID=UPI000722CDD0|nr:hypothetical protein [Aureimonas sp. AU20]ALN73538.1 hypothetical protein M673_12495 [Aureimonas sp. AU20]
MSDTNGAEAAPSLDYITPDDGFDATASDTAEQQNDDLAPEGDEGEPELDLDLEAEAPKPGDENADEFEEIERNGKKYRIPAALKGELMMQADYTRKTQEVAAARKELETHQAAVEQQRQMMTQQAEMQHANIQDFARLVNLNDQLAQYEQVDWAAYEKQDPFAANAAWREYHQLEKARNNLAGELHHKQQQAQQDHQRRTLEAQQSSRAEIAKRAEETMKVLTSKVPGWNQEVATEVSSYAMNVSGYSQDELVNAVGDPRAFILLHKAMSYDKAMAKAADRAAKARQQEAVAPLTTVPRGNTSPAPTGLDDRLSADEWARRRNEQVRKRGR